MAKPMRDAFAERTNRFRLLNDGIHRVEWNRSDRILEIGCSTGEAAAYVSEQIGASVTGVDFDASAITAATELYGGERCSFVCANAGDLPFDRASFDGIYCEAAFAPLEEKERAAAEYARVLKNGTLLLMNDFVIQFETSETERNEVDGIPCFRGVQTMKTYQSLFQKFGFTLIYEREEYPELIRIVLRMSQIYGVAPSELGGYLLRKFSSAEGEKAGTEFFSNARMTYCQMIFKRNENDDREVSQLHGEN